MRAPLLPSTAALLLFVVSACSSHAPPRTPQTEARVTSTGSLGDGGFGAVAGAASEDAAAVPISVNDPSWGDRRALVSLVVFGDLECPYTGKILKTVHALEDRYGPTRLRVVWKELPLPFHPQARPAAEAAETVFTLGRADAFWKFWDLALAHQAELSSFGFETWAAAAGVDAASFRRAMDARASQAKVDADMALAQRLGVQGTPTFFVNGSLLVGAQPEDAFVTAIDAGLAKAKERLAAGVTEDALYTDLARANWTAPAPPPEPAEEKEDTTTVFNVPTGNGPVRGRPDALVTIVLFSDFQCPFCKRVEPTLKQVRETYGDKVRIVWRDEPLPFHPHALPAAELAREARAEKGDAGFWAAHDAIFEAQPNLSDDDLLALGRTLGLDAGKVRGALEGKRYAAQIQVDLDAAEAAHADGTPHMFINGRRLAGAQPFEEMKPIIDEEIQHAQALLARGTPARALYDTMMNAVPIGEARQAPPRAGAPFRGPAGAPVVIEEFADFQCPFCARAEATLGKLTELYGPRVKFVWRNLPLPFHAHAEEAAEAALEAQRQKGNTGFWAMHDKLFAHAQDGGRKAQGAGLARAAIESYAREIGLDVAALDRALDAHTHQAEVKADLDAAAAAHLDGAPSFLVGGYLLVGAQPVASFRRLIDHALQGSPGVVAK